MESNIDNAIKIEGKGMKLDIDMYNTDDDSVYYYKLEKDEKLKNLMDRLYKKLEETHIPKIKGKSKDGTKTRGDKLGYNAYTFTFGCGDRRNLGVGEFSANKKHPELFNMLVEFGNMIVPKGYAYQAITVNKDMKAKKHIDGLNTGFSVITAMGDFTGGGLNVYEDGKNKPKTLYDLKDHILIFNGSILYHQTDKFVGRRYSFVFYSQKAKCKIKNKKLEGS